MEKKTTALLGALAGLAGMGVAHAAIPPAPNASQAFQAQSYADLLAPVANASALLKADDIANANPVTRDGMLQLADDRGEGGYAPPRQDHHHHHQAYRRRDHHHHHQAYYQQSHHHHHQRGNYVGIPGVGGIQLGRR